MRGPRHATRPAHGKADFLRRAYGERASAPRRPVAAIEQAFNIISTLATTTHPHHV